jgi:hypothetical protein
MIGGLRMARGRADKIGYCAVEDVNLLGQYSRQLRSKKLASSFSTRSLRGRHVGVRRRLRRRMDVNGVGVDRLGGNAAHLSHRQNQSCTGVRVFVCQWRCRSLVITLHLGETRDRIGLFVIVDDGVVVGAEKDVRAGAIIPH